MSDSEARFKAIVDANRYMTLATADAEGHPWVSPVWFATSDYREFFWVSRPEARHSRNISVRPELAIAIFDSQQPPGTGEGAYLWGRAELVPEPERAGGIAVFSTVSEANRAGAWDRTDIEPPAPLRLYRATVAEHFVLSPGDRRLPVRLD